MPWPTMPQVIVYQDGNFGGNSWLTSIAPGWGWNYVGDNWNDQISSVIVLSGTWQFFENGGFTGASTTVGPGWYTWVENPQFNMQNDSISSILCVDWNDNPPITG
jgi:Beta/Gamma crystallin